MSFSQNFLDKLLNSAINYYNFQPKNISKIPNTFDNIKSSLEYFNNSLKYEANKSLQNEILTDTPVLHAVNLNSKNPGIISHLIDKKVSVYKKKKEKKPKTQKQIEKEIERKLLQKEKKEEKKYIKEGKKKINNLDKQIKQIIKNTKKIIKDRDKQQKIIKNKDIPTSDDYKILESYNNKIDQNTNKKKELELEYNNFNNEYSVKKEIYDKKIQTQKIEKEKRKKIREEKKKQKELEMKEKRKDKELEFADELMGLYDQLFDVTMEKTEEEKKPNRLVPMDNLILFESPLPFQRHINALSNSSPNKVLIPALLRGEPVLKGGILKLYHGPPGTGKTYTLLNKLSILINKSKHNKILVCATSNVGTVNLYNRAKDFNIKGSLIISQHNNLLKQFSTEEIKNWKPKTDKIIFSTISMRHGRVLSKIEFDTILIDEAAQCQESWFWGLLRNNVKYIYMAGDPNQLPALVSQEGIKLQHGRSCMTRLLNLKYPAQLLNVQRRMHPNIVKFPNETFYQGKLKTEYTGIKTTLEPYLIINVDGQEKRIGTSFQNEDEVKIILELHNKIKKEIENIVVISPYTAQCELINKMSNNTIQVYTVDSYQGREADAIILTTVRTGSTIGFWNDARRLNVGLTRGRHVLRIIGKTDTWKKSNGPLKLLLSNGKIIKKLK